MGTSHKSMLNCVGQTRFDCVLARTDLFAVPPKPCCYNSLFLTQPYCFVLAIIRFHSYHSRAGQTRVRWCIRADWSSAIMYALVLARHKHNHTYKATIFLEKETAQTNHLGYHASLTASILTKAVLYQLARFTYKTFWICFPCSVTSFLSLQWD